MKSLLESVKTVILSRTDAIGDVVLALPLAGFIKEHTNGRVRVLFLGKTYTAPVIQCCSNIDGFLNYDAFTKFSAEGKTEWFREAGADAIVHVFPRQDIAVAAKAAGLKWRIGTMSRAYHWTTCNRLVVLGRRNSDLHEAELNARLIRDTGLIGNIPPLQNFSRYYGMTRIPDLPEKYHDLMASGKFNLILHPKSNVSAREWSLDHYRDLIRYLPKEKFQIFITGSAAERSLLSEWIKTLPQNVIDTTGSLSLQELITFIHLADGIVAASTGPLHIASAFGKHALGIYPPIRPMHPGRWAPIGLQSEYLVKNKSCSDCRQAPKNCHCMNEISAADAAGRIMTWLK